MTRQAFPWTNWLRRRRIEEGRRLANEREDLIARGVDPALLHTPLHPDDK